MTPISDMSFDDAQYNLEKKNSSFKNKVKKGIANRATGIRGSKNLPMLEVTAPDIDEGDQLNDKEILETNTPDYPF